MTTTRAMETKSTQATDLKKFLVIVNGKIIVQVESTSNGGAEHKVMDNIRYIKDALAFDPMTEAAHFAWAFDKCKIMSYEELESKSNEYHKEVTRIYNDLLADVSTATEEVKRLKDELWMAEGNLKYAKEQAETYRKQYGLTYGFTDQYNAKDN